MAPKNPVFFTIDASRCNLQVGDYVSPDTLKNIISYLYYY